MITYRIAFVGDKQGIYSKAVEYFSNIKHKDGFQIELVDISNLSELDIRSMHFHSIVYDINEVIQSQNDYAIETLLKTKKHISDFKIFPLSNTEVTRENVEEEEKRLLDLLGEDEKIQAIPINVSRQSDLKSVFQALEIASIQYKDLAEDALESHQIEFDLTAKKLLEAMEEKSPYTASHFRQVGTFSEAIARYMGKDEFEVRKTKAIAILHDAGKLLIPEELLETSHITVGSERAQMDLHSELGEVVIAQGLFNTEERGGIVEHHNKLTNNKYAKIIAVADCIDTMASQRAYNNPKAIQEVFRDLATNMHSRTYTADDGRLVNVPAQFDKNVATAAIVMLANELGKIGYDVRDMLEITSSQNTLKADKELQKIFEEHQDEIMVDATAKEGEYNSLGFRLTKTGHLQFDNRPAAVIDRKTRVRSEYEVLIRNNSTPEQKARASTIMDLEANFSLEKLEIFRREAEDKILMEDEMGRKAVEAGQKNQKNRMIQVIEAASHDKEYSSDGYTKFIGETSRIINLQKDREENEEQRGA